MTDFALFLPDFSLFGLDFTPTGDPKVNMTVGPLHRRQTGEQESHGDCSVECEKCQEVFQIKKLESHWLEAGRCCIICCWLEGVVLSDGMSKNV